MHSSSIISLAVALLTVAPAIAFPFIPADTPIGGRRGSGVMPHGHRNGRGNGRGPMAPMPERISSRSVTEEYELEDDSAEDNIAAKVAATISATESAYAVPTAASRTSHPYGSHTGIPKGGSHKSNGTHIHRPHHKMNGTRTHSHPCPSGTGTFKFKHPRPSGSGRPHHPKISGHPCKNGTAPASPKATKGSYLANSKPKDEVKEKNLYARHAEEEDADEGDEEVDGDEVDSAAKTDDSDAEDEEEEEEDEEEDDGAKRVAHVPTRTGFAHPSGTATGNHPNISEFMAHLGHGPVVHGNGPKGAGPSGIHRPSGVAAPSGFPFGKPSGIPSAFPKGPMTDEKPDVAESAKEDDEEDDEE